MTSNSTLPGSATNTVSSGARSAGSQAMRAAGRQLLTTAGNQVLKVAVDRAVGKVDHVAGRLDAVAAGEHRKPTSRPPTSRKSQPPARQDESEAEHPLRVKVGVAFNLVVQQAIRLLQLVQRLARQLLDALSRLFRRGDEADADATDEAGPPDTASQGVDRMAPRKRVDKTARAGEGRQPERARPAVAQPARPAQAPRRQGPRPAAQEAGSAPRRREAGKAPRRVAGDRPVRAVRND